MNPLPFAAVVATIGTLAHAGEVRSYDFSGFDSIQSSAGVAVVVTEGENFSVEAEAIRGNLRRLEIEQSGDTLTIGRKNSWGLFSIGRRDRFEITVTLPDLEEAHASSGSSMAINGSGSGDLDLQASSGATLTYEGSVGGDLDINASSGATLTAIDIQAIEVEADASSGASVHLNGTCQEIEAEAGSGASLNARDMVCATGEAKVTGGASMNVHVTQTLAAKGSGGASLRVYGNPKTERSTSGGASIVVN